MSIAFTVARRKGDKGDAVDTYTVSKEGVELSPVLPLAVGELDGEPVSLPVTFEDRYMRIVETYLNHFAHTPLPLKIATPLPKNADVAILHPRIYGWLREFTLDDLARCRQVCMYFEIDVLIDQIDAMLAITILKNPKDMFSQFHDSNFTLASKDRVMQQFPILG
jgi:hypothetical protein